MNNQTFSDGNKPVEAAESLSEKGEHAVTNHDVVPTAITENQNLAPGDRGTPEKIMAVEPPKAQSDAPRHRWTPQQQLRVDAALDLYLYYLVNHYALQDAVDGEESGCEHRSVFLLMRRFRHRAAEEISHRRPPPEEATQE